MVAKLAGWAKQAGDRVLRLHRLNIGPRLTLCFVFIILAMLVGNAVLLWQFHLVPTQARRLSGVDQELIAVLRARTDLMSFYERLELLAHSEDPAQAAREAAVLRNALIAQSRRTTSAFSSLPAEVKPDPAVLPTLETVQAALPAQLDAITGLAESGEWEAVRLRLANEVRPLESRISELVENIDREVGEQRAQALLNIGQAQRRTLLSAPITAGLTLLFATFLGLAITRSITQPLGELMEASQALGRSEFQHRVATIGNDELAHLGRAFNKTAGTLRDLYETLSTREAYLAEAQRISHTGSFGWNVSTGELVWSDETFRIFECSPSVKPTLQLVMERTHPEDAPLVRQLLDRVTRDRTGWELEHRLRMPDGSVKYLQVVSHPRISQSGGFEFLGAVTDMTERKRAEEALRRSEGYLAEAQRLTHSGSWAWTVRTRDTFWSQEMFRILGLDPAHTKPSFPQFLERVHPEERAWIEQRASMEASQAEGAYSAADYRIVLADGTTRHVHSVAHPVLSDAGEVLEVVGTTVDVTEQHEARVALETAFEEIKVLRDQLHKENIALRDEIDKKFMFEEVVGDSPALRAVLARVAKVAPTDSTVLVTGETGTGKELIARAIHKRSRRSSRAFLSVNCAAIPATLIASELFGHEKGAFTGAFQRRLGRFELAEGGTIFLDEIGELPAETQIALLRVLQEREFDRIGGAQPIRADVRVIAATNRDLDAAVAAGTFRKDLFYRLNVFPIHVPPLRERKEDIPTLVEYFIHRYSRQAGKKIGNLERKTVGLLESYSWPGNIREMQNVIERSVIVYERDPFTVDPNWLSVETVSAPQPNVPLARKSAAEEKAAIETVLAATGGRVSGPSGAAAQLGMPASTLESRIRSLKINKFRFKKI